MTPTETSKSHSSGQARWTTTENDASNRGNIKEPTLVVFADDWGRHPSSCQHLVRHLLDRWQVTWINTIGTRSPGLNRETFRRGWEKLRQWKRVEASPTMAEGRQPRVLSPRMWPRFTTRPERRLNQRILTRFLKRNVPGLHNSVVLTTLPIVADLVGRIDVRKWVYYCVDDFSTWPGLDARPLRQMEDRLIAAVDHVVAAGENLAGPLRGRAKDTRLLSHGVELDFWNVSGERDNALPTDLRDLQRPLVVFWGLVDRRLDIDCLQRLGQQMRGGNDRADRPRAGARSSPRPRSALAANWRQALGRVASHGRRSQCVDHALC